MGEKPSWKKLVLGNLAVAMALLWGLNLVAAVGFDLHRWIVTRLPPVDEKAYRHAAAEAANAVEVFREYAQLQTRYVPYLGWLHHPFTGSTTTIDANGDRRHRRIAADAPGPHVRLFGGSTMWGKGVDDRHTVAAQINDLNPDASVYNHGVSGYVSRQELQRLINLVNDGEPMDTVIFYDGCNDLFTLCRADVSINGHREQAKIIRRMEPYSHTAQTFFSGLRPLAETIARAAELPSRCQENPDEARRVAATLVNNWRIAKMVAESAGARFHAVLQPVALVGRPNIAHLEGMLGDTRSRDYRLLYPLVQEIIRNEPGEWMHDFTDALDGGEAVYIDGCHLNGRGNAIIASRLDELLKRRAPASD
ncbi:MAG TPA: hypothetical protein VEB21_17040 [Terriglobales bacterium]|nr:hypothetical protein [Terriglobales bacterium]